MAPKRNYGPNDALKKKYMTFFAKRACELGMADGLTVDQTYARLLKNIRTYRYLSADAIGKGRYGYYDIINKNICISETMAKNQSVNIHEIGHAFQRATLLDRFRRAVANFFAYNKADRQYRKDTYSIALLEGSDESMTRCICSSSQDKVRDRLAGDVRDPLRSYAKLARLADQIRFVVGDSYYWKCCRWDHLAIAKKYDRLTYPGAYRELAHKADEILEMNRGYLTLRLEYKEKCEKLEKSGSTAQIQEAKREFEARSMAFIRLARMRFEKAQNITIEGYFQSRLDRCPQDGGRSANYLYQKAKQFEALGYGGESNSFKKFMKHLTFTPITLESPADVKHSDAPINDSKVEFYVDPKKPQEELQKQSAIPERSSSPVRQVSRQNAGRTNDPRVNAYISMTNPNAGPQLPVFMQRPQFVPQSSFEVIKNARSTQMPRPLQDDKPQQPLGKR